MQEKKRVPKLRFPEFTGEWESKKLGKLINEYKGGASLKPTDFINEGVKVLPKAGIVKGGTIRVEKDRQTYCSNEYAIINKNSLVDKKYTITVLRDLVPSGPSIGLVAKIDSNDNYILAQGVYGLLINNKEMIPQHLIQFSNSIKYRKIMRKTLVGSTQVHIRTPDYFNIKINLPSLLEQEKIASFLSKVDEKIEKLERKKELWEEYKKGVMQKIFSREIRFKDDEGQEFCEWEEKSLGKIGKTYNGLTGKTKENFGIGKPYIQYKQIFDSSQINENFGFVEVLDNENQNKVKYGDIFFTTSSETPGEVGMSSVLLNEIDETYLNSFCFGYRPNSLKQLYPLFSRYLFRSDIARKEIVKLAQGSTRYNMSKNEFMKIKIKLPSLPEQEKISNFLSNLDTKIDVLEREIERNKEFKRGLLQQLFC